jgi:chromosome segregation ATPase
MPTVGEVSFELERFEWTADDRLEVVGRWNGVRGRRVSRPALTVDAGGRRQRLSGSQESEEPWSASFAWSGDDIAGAELEIGRSLVVELPPPRRRRRRSGASAESDLRMQLDELRAAVADLRAERAIAPSAEALHTAEAERDRLAAELEALRDDTAPDDRVAAITADRDRLATELEALHADTAADDRVAAERDRLAAELEALRVDTEAERDRLSAALAAAEAESAERLAERDRLAGELADRAPDERLSELEAELASLRETQGERGVEADQELAGLRLAHGSLRAAHEALEDELEELRGVRDERDELAGQIEQLKAAAGDTENEKTSLGALVRELESARETLSADLAVAREELARLERGVAERDRSLADAQQDAGRRVEIERATTTEVHSRLATAREEAQKSMVAEAAETELLREELEHTRAESERQLAAERAEVARLREELLSSEVDEGADEASRRMVERITRDLERERATSRALKHDLDTLRSETSEQRRHLAAFTANGTLSMDEPPARAVRTPEGTQRRVDAARAAASQRVPRVPPSPYALWAVRVIATLTCAALLVALVVLVKLAT